MSLFFSNFIDFLYFFIIIFINDDKRTIDERKKRERKEPINTRKEIRQEIIMSILVFLPRIDIQLVFWILFYFHVNPFFIHLSNIFLKSHLFTDEKET